MAMALPPEGETPETESPPDRPGLRLIEARDASERRCMDCGKRTSSWKPVRRKGVPVILCLDCAAKPPPPEDGCPECGAPLTPHDTFCGRCGTKIEYECPQCGGALDAEDTFCGKCGTKLG